jgi:hypothetical protein
MKKQQEHAYTLIKTYAFSPSPLSSGFGLWKRVSSVMQQRKGKNCEFALFFFRAWRFCFFHARFSLLSSVLAS